jgi:hypothetical protein
MRMWMIKPSGMCDQHLLGEHVELHMIVGSLAKGREASVQGLIRKGLVEPQNIEARHAALVKEMTRRGMQHKSPLPVPKSLPVGKVYRAISRTELRSRCLTCSRLLEAR